MIDIICDDTGEKFTKYSDYMQSRHWLNLKNRFKKSGLYKGFCHICNDKKKLHLHHKTYKRIGNEHLNELIELCEKCHFDLHDIIREKKEYNSRDIWIYVSKIRKKRIKKEKRNYKKGKKSENKKELDLKWINQNYK